MNDFEDIKSIDPKMFHLLETARRVARSASSVLITGESGTGKELVARGIHRVSARSHGPFVAVNCGAIPKDLLESELIGYERGAFTGALNTKIGDFETANGGTIFLDEISTLPIHLQVKLLRVLQEHEIKRLGSTKTIRLDFRVISATNEDLSGMVDKGAFRHDLYFRLNVIPLHIPPLRERKEDIPILLEHFIERACSKLKKRKPGFSKDVVSVLQGWRWPGNVREFENLIERIIVLMEEGKDVTIKDLPAEIIFKGSQDYRAITEDVAGLKERCMVYEKGEIIRTLHDTKWNRGMAARVLRIHRNTLIQKMKKLRIPY